MKFQRIQDLRSDADLSQRELSEILHISQRSYSHYETGSRNIPVENPVLQIKSPFPAFTSR